MALEQWEIDLRQQLEGKININPQDKLMEEIQPLPRRSEKSTDNTLLMLALFIVLGCAMLFAYDSKSGKIQSWLSGSGDVRQLSLNHKNNDTDIVLLRADLQKLNADTIARLDKLTTSTQSTENRLALMGMLLNENFMIVRNNHDKGHLVFFNRDWTLNQMPHYIQLSDDDKEYLKKYVKPKDQ